MQALALVVIFAAANVVAAGVLLVLGPYVLGLEGPALVLAVLATFTAAVGAALLFIRGAIHAARDQLRYPRQRGG